MAISDAAVKAKTGKEWKSWFSLLDRAGAARMDHAAIAALLRERFGCPPWWSQMVANAYEQARGLRKKHQMPDGYQVGASKTFGFPVRKLYSAFTEREIRSGWLKGDRLEITTATKDKSIRARWGETRIDVNFYPKEGKTQVSLGHNKIKSAAEAAKMKRFWKDAFLRLGRLIS